MMEYWVYITPLPQMQQVNFLNPSSMIPYG